MRRLGARFAALRQGGFRAYIRTAHLQTAQLDLAMQRWHVERRESDDPPETVEDMRSRALAMRAARA